MQFVIGSFLFLPVWESFREYPKRDTPIVYEFDRLHISILMDCFGFSLTSTCGWILFRENRYLNNLKITPIRSCIILDTNISIGWCKLILSGLATVMRAALDFFRFASSTPQIFGDEFIARRAFGISSSGLLFWSTLSIMINKKSFWSWDEWWYEFSKECDALDCVRIRWSSGTVVKLCFSGKI